MIDRLLKRRRTVLAVFGVLLGPALWLCTLLPLEADLLELLPPDVPEIRSLRKVEQWGVTLGYTYVGLVAPEGTDTVVLESVASAVLEEMKAHPLVDHVDDGFDLDVLQRVAMLRMDPDDVPRVADGVRDFLRQEKRRRSGFFIDLEEEDEAGVNPFGELVEKYAGRCQVSLENGGGGQGEMLDALHARVDTTGRRVWYLSGNGRMLLFALRPTFSSLADERFPRLLADLERAIDAAVSGQPSFGVEAFIGGAYPLEYEQRETILADAARAASLSALAILLVAFVSLRRWRAVAAVFASLAIALTLTFGLVKVTAGSVNMITVFLLAILAGLGVDFGLYFMTRRDLLMKRGLAPEQATRDAWRQTSAPAALGAFTTMAVFLLLAAGEFRGFAQLGFISAIGMVVAWISMYTLLPLLVEKEGARPVVQLPSAMRPRRLGAGLVCAVAAIVTVIAGGSATRVRFAFEGNELTVEGQKSLEVDERIIEHFGENIDRSVVVADTEERARRIQAFFEDQHGKLPEVARYDSIFTWLPLQEQQDAVREQFPELRRVLARLPGRNEDPAVEWMLQRAKGMQSLESVALDDLPVAIRRRHVGVTSDDGIAGYIGLISPRTSLWDVTALERFVDGVASLRVDGEPLEVTGRAQVFLRIIRLVQSEARQFSLVGALLVLGILWLQARRLRFALLAMLPLAAGLVWTFGAMPYIGSGLNITFLNVIVFPVLIGLGVSYGIQIVYAFRLYGSAETALQVTRRAVLGSAATTLAGWSTLLTASMIGLRGMGWLATLGMLSIAGFSLLVLPSVLELLHRSGLIQPDLLLAPPEQPPSNEQTRAAA